MMANPTKIRIMKIMSEIVNLNAAEKNLQHTPGLLGLKEI